jgi:hypothetical protein
MPEDRSYRSCWRWQDVSLVMVERTGMELKAERPPEAVRAIIRDLVAEQQWLMSLGELTEGSLPATYPGLFGVTPKEGLTVVEFAPVELENQPLA